MKKLFFLILFFVSIQSFGQRFPSVDSLQNYILRYVRNSTVESFTNLRMQNVVYGLSELLESRAVDSIWRVAGKDSIFFRKNGATYAIKDSTGGSYTASNGLTLSGSNFKLGGTLSDAATEVIAPFTKELYFKAYGAGGGLGNVGNRSELSIYNGGLNLYQYNSGSVEGGIEINSSGLSIFKTGGALNLGSTSQIFLKNGSSGVYSQTTTDTTASKPLVLNTSTGLVSRMTSWPSPSLTLQQVTDNGNSTNKSIQFSADSAKIKFRTNLELYSDESGVLTINNPSLGNFYTLGFAFNTDFRNYQFPNKSGTLPLSVRLNGTTYTSNDTGSIELGTITGGISDTSRIVTIDKTQTITGRKTFNGQTFFNKDSVTRTTGKQWYAVIDTTTGQLQRQQVTAGIPTIIDTAHAATQMVFIDRFIDLNTAQSGFVTKTLISTGTGSGLQFPGTYNEDVLNTVRISSGSQAATSRSCLVAQGTYISPGTTPIILEYRINNNVVGSAADAHIIKVGMFAQTANVDETNGAFFLYDTTGTSTGSTASARWQCVTANSSNRTFTNTSVNIISGWVKFKIRITSTRCEFFINNTLVAVHTTNIPVADRPNIYIRKQTGSTLAYLWPDYFAIYKTFSTPK